MAQMNLVVDEIQSELAMLQRQIRVVGAMEQTTAQLDERVYLAEQSMDSIITFRQETNRKLDQLATQIRNLQY
jgi:septal ring factor EnvC (AmiA/AmiB activator)